MKCCLCRKNYPAAHYWYRERVIIVSHFYRCQACDRRIYDAVQACRGYRRVER
jgi:hypothetical protein